MGIKGLRNFLKNYYKNTDFETQVNFRKYKNRIVAIDAPMFVCAYKIVRIDDYEEALINLIVSLLECEIKPIFVFDGDAPREKSLEKKKRAEKKKNQYLHVEQLEQGMKNYEKYHIITPKLWEINNTKIKKSRLFTNFSPRLVQKYIERLRSQILEINNTDFIKLQKLLIYFGVPFLLANGEAEILCANLVKSGIADAVISKDMDVLACSSPIMLRDCDLPSHQFLEINLNPILTYLGLTHESWLDFCIMCGTDFNNNIPQIGPNRAFMLIKKYTTLENITQQGEIDTSILDYKNTRKLFLNKQCPEKHLIPPFKSPNYVSITDHINTNKLKINPVSIRRRLNTTVRCAAPEEDALHTVSESLLSSTYISSADLRSRSEYFGSPETNTNTIRGEQHAVTSAARHAVTSAARHDEGSDPLSGVMHRGGAKRVFMRLSPPAFNKTD